MLHSLRSYSASCFSSSMSCLMLPPLPIPTLFPYTTLFRSHSAVAALTPPPTQVPARPHRGGTVAAAADRGPARPARGRPADRDRKSTRLNSSHVAISYAVFCLKKKNRDRTSERRHISFTL